MLGQRPPLQRELFCYASEVPPTRLSARTRELQAAFDWDAVRARAQASFDPTTGRPSLDPAVVVKLLLLHKLTGCRSWRWLVEFASDSMACHEFLGYAWSESLPSHQALCDWRQRLGAEFFEDLLVDVVRHCQREGMVLSSVRVVDATAVKAQADREGPTVWVDAEADELAVWLAVAGYTEDEEGRAGTDDDPPPVPGRLPQRPPVMTEVPAEAPAKRAGGAQRLVSRHDPEARLSAKPGLPREFYYQVSLASDPVSGLVTSSIVRPTEEPGTLLAHMDAEPGLVAVAVADCHYDTVEVMAGLSERGITPMIPHQDHQRQHGYRREQFAHNGELDCYQCPEGALLTLAATMADGRRRYQAPASACQSCRRRAWCTASRSRSMTVLAGSEARDEALRAGYEYDLRQGQRRTQEHLWNVGKRDYGLRRADGLGVEQLRISAALVAVCINVGKLLKWRAQGPSALAGAMAQEVLRPMADGLACAERRWAA